MWIDQESAARIDTSPIDRTEAGFRVGTCGCQKDALRSLQDAGKRVKSAAMGMSLLHRCV